MPRSGWVWPVRGTSRADINRADKPGEGDGNYATHRTRGRHRGIDIAAVEGTDVLAAASGTVFNILPNPSSTFGSQRVIQHAGSLFSQYAHLKTGSAVVRPGDPVTAGDKIAEVGRTGNTPSQGDTHLHFEIRSGSAVPASAGSVTVDPLDYLP